MIKYQIVYWRDIPSQVICQQDGKRSAAQLSQRFQEAIDRVAMSSGATGTDDYLATWRKSEWLNADVREGNAESLALSLVSMLEEKFSVEHLRSLELNGGYESKEGV